MRRILIGFLVLLPTIHANGQNVRRDPVLYPEKLREDTEILRALIHEAHPDPYRYASKEQLDAMFDRVIDSLAIPVNADRYIDILMPVFHLLGDAHCYPEPGAIAQEHLQHNVPVIPLKVQSLADGLYVEEELKGFRSLPPGARIVAINDVPMDALLERMERLVVADGSNRTLSRHLVEQDFPELLNRAMGDTSAFRLLLRVGDSEEQRTIFAMTGDEIARSRKPAGPALMPWRAEWEPESNAVWVSLRALDDDSLESAGQSSGRFLTAMLQEVEKNVARTLVLDLRGAGGSDLALAEQVFATIAKKPFRAVQRITARSAAPPQHYDLVMPKPEYYASIGKHYVTDPVGTMAPPGDERLQQKEPMHGAFQGKVYVVCDGATRDAAAMLVMMAKRTGRARIVGEEIGSNALSITGGGELLATTPNAGIRVHVPLVRYFPEGQCDDACDRGEMPMYPLEQQASGIARGRDTVKETLLRMLREL